MARIFVKYSDPGRKRCQHTQVLVYHRYEVHQEDQL